MLEKHTSYNKTAVVKNTLYQFFGKIISAATTFSITILLAKSYGVSGFADFVKITTYIGFFYILCDFGLNAVAVSFYNRDDNKITFYFSNLLTLRFAISLCAIFLALVILIFLPKTGPTGQGFSIFVKIGAIILIPSIISQSIYTSCNSVFQKYLRYDKSLISILIYNFFLFLLIVFVTFYHLPILFAIFSYTLGSIFLFLSSFIQVKLMLKEITLFFKFEQWQKYFITSIPLGLILLFNLIYFHFDIMVLTFFRSNTEVGLYGLAYKLFEFPLALSTFVMNSLYPLMLKKTDQTQLAAFSKKAIIMLFLLSLTFIILGWFSAPFIVYIKHEFHAAIGVFRTLLLFLPFFFITNYLMWLFIVIERRIQLVLIYMLVLFINIILCLLFIPKFGIRAALVITGLSEFITLILLIFSVIYYFKYLPKKAVNFSQSI